MHRHRLYRKSFSLVNSRLPKQFRQGISTLEFIGCLIAVAGGVWVGARYSGLNLKEAWNAGAKEVGYDSLQLPEEDTKETTTAEGYLPENPTWTEETMPLVDDAHSNFAPKTFTPPEDKLAVQKARIGKRTLAYWNSLNQIMEQEEKMRTPPTEGIQAGNASKFMANRSAAGKFASAFMLQLPTQDVDPRAVAIAKDIASWYELGVEINAKGTYLLEQASPSTRRGEMGKEWRTMEMQHQKEAELLNRRADTLRMTFSHEYQLAFPDLR